MNPLFPILDLVIMGNNSENDCNNDVLISNNDSNNKEKQVIMM